jgi:hypothetical protein
MGKGDRSASILRVRVLLALILLGVFWLPGLPGLQAVPAAVGNWIHQGVSSFLEVGVLCLAIPALIHSYWGLVREASAKALVLVLGTYCFAALVSDVSFGGATTQFRGSAVAIQLMLGMLVPILLLDSVSLLRVGFTVVTAQAITAGTLFIAEGTSFYSGTLARAGGTFNDPNTLCLLLLAWIPIGLTLLMRETQLRWRLVLGVSLVVYLVTLTMTWHRMAFPALAAGLCTSLVLLRASRRAVVSAAVLLTILTAITYAARSLPGNLASSERSSYGRLLVWKHSFHEIQRLWPDGLGVGRTALVIPELPSRSDGSAEVVWDAKSAPLHVVLELGILGFSILVAMLVFTVQCCRHSQSLYLPAFAGALAAAGIFGVPNTPFASYGTVSGNMLLGFLMGGLALCGSDHAADSSVGRLGRYVSEMGSARSLSAS